MVTVVHIYHDGAEEVAATLGRVAPERRVVVCPPVVGDALAEAEVLFASVPVPADLAKAERLRLIQLMGVGAESVMGAPEIRPDVAIAGLGDTFAAETSEYVLAMMLAHCRALPTLVRRQDQKMWRQFGAATLAGTTLGVLGLGQIGGRVAALAHAFGMHVIGMRRSPAPVPHVQEVLGPEGLPSILSRVDYAAVCMPLTPETRGMLDAAALSHLRPHAVLVHVGRGGIVDEHALLEMLREGRLGGAAIDVFQQEPLPRHSPLWEAPNTLVTPHLAGLGRRYLERAAEVLSINLQRLDRGEPPLFAIDRERGY